MSTETINIVVQESGAPEAAAAISSVGEAATVSDAALSNLLARSGTTSAAMQAITTAGGTATASLNQMAAGATNATAALGSASSGATSASTRIAAVGASGEEAAVGMRAASSAGAALVASFRAAASAGEQAALAETSVAAASAREAAGHVAAATAATAHGAALHRVGEEGEVLQNKLERLEIAFIALGVALGIKDLIAATDAYANMSNQLQRIKVNAADFAAKQDDIFRIAQESRQPLEAINGLYVNMAQAMRTTTVGAKPLSQAIETLALGATVSGKSISETAAALNRLGISLREGGVNGRGFLQFLVQMPEIGEKVAANLNFVGATGFKRFVDAANAGKISSEAFVRALAEINPVMLKEMKAMEVTVASAFVTLKNAWLDYIGRADAAAGTSEKIAHVIQELAQHIGAVIGVIGVFTFALSAYGLAVGTAAVATAALSFSMAGIVGIVAGAVAAIFFFGNSIKITADGTVTAFSLVFGAIKTVIQVLGELIHWVKSTEEGTIAFQAALVAVAGVLARLYFGNIITALVSLTTAMWAFVSPILTVVGALATLTAAILAVRYAFIAWRDGFTAANADLAQTRDKVLALANDIKDKFAKNISDTSTPLVKLKDDVHNVGDAAAGALPNIVRFGQGATGQFKDLSDAADSANIKVINGFKNSGAAIKQLGTDSADTAASFTDSMGKMTDATGKVDNAVSVMGNQVQSSGALVRNALGQMVQATDDWAARSGADFNKVAQEAIASSNAATQAMSKVMNTVQGPHSQGTGATGSTGWGGSGGENLQGDWFGSTNTGQSGGSWGISDLSQWYGATGGSGIADINFGSSGFYATGGEFIVGGSGGTDSQMVNFMATPGERVTVETPGQQAANDGKSNGGDYQRPINVNMYISTPDANSFRESQTAMTLKLQNQLRRVNSQLGGP